MQNQMNAVCWECVEHHPLGGAGVLGAQGLPGDWTTCFQISCLASLCQESQSHTSMQPHSCEMLRVLAKQLIFNAVFQPRLLACFLFRRGRATNSTSVQFTAHRSFSKLRPGQVKVRGFRVELAEVELSFAAQGLDCAVLALPSACPAVLVAFAPRFWFFGSWMCCLESQNRKGVSHGLGHVVTLPPMHG